MTGSRLIRYNTSDLGGISGCVGPLICSAFLGSGWGGDYSYWNYMPSVDSLGDKDGRYISASYMNDLVDKQRASKLFEISRKMGPLMVNIPAFSLT